jgi:hypothetical protein
MKFVLAMLLQAIILMLVEATRLLEMELPEDKILEKLNKVSTAKRQAYMVSESLPGDP